MAGAILGPDGRPARIAGTRLQRRTSAPTPYGLRQAWQWFSVVTGLTPARLREIYAAVARGTWCPDYFELATELEERDAHYAAVLQQRILAAAGEKLEVVPADDSAAAVREAELVERRLVEGPGWHGLVVDLLDAVPKGVALIEVVWSRPRTGGRMRPGEMVRTPRWAPAAYYRIDPRWIVMAPDGETPYLLSDDRSARVGAAWAPLGNVEALEPGKHLWHVHRVRAGQPFRGGLAFTQASYWLLKSLAIRDWWSYAETYGLPFRIGRYPATATTEDIRTLIDAVSALAVDAGAVIPDSMNIELLAAGSGAAKGSEGLHASMARWCDRQTSQLVVGQTMTTEDGASRAQAQVHDEVRRDLVRDDVRQVAETLTRLAHWFCALNGAPEHVWPRIALPPVVEDLDVSAVMEAVRGGLRVPAGWLRSRLGVPDPAPGEEIVARPAAEPGSGGDKDDDEDDDEDDPPPPRRRALQAAESPPPAAAAAAAAMTEPVEDALASAATPDAFVAAATGGELPGAWVEALALATFRARAAAEIETGGDGAGGVELDEVRPAGHVPAAARRFLAGKGRTISRHWTDVWREEHAGAFTAAWLDRDDLVAAVHQALTRSLARGETMESFRGSIQPWLQRAGWAPPERGGSVPRRLARIYRTNTRVAHAAGRWQAAVAADQRSPGRWLLRYELGPSRDHREAHAAWAARPTLLPVSDPWWATHFPPNGWGCRCRARLVPAAEAGRAGAPAGAPPVEMVDRAVEEVDGLTGEVTTRRVQVPRGIDPSWDYNPGAHRLDGANQAAVNHLDRILQGRSSSGRPNAWASVGKAERAGLARRRIAAHLESRTFAVLREERPGVGPGPHAWSVETPVAAVPLGHLGVGAPAGEVLRATADVVRRAPGEVDWTVLQRMADAGGATGGDGRWRLAADGWAALVARDARGRLQLLELGRAAGAAPPVPRRRPAAEWRGDLAAGERALQGGPAGALPPVARKWSQGEHGIGLRRRGGRPPARPSRTSTGGYSRAAGGVTSDSDRSTPRPARAPPARPSSWRASWGPTSTSGRSCG